PLVADQDVDGAVEVGRGAQCKFEPDLEILRSRWNALLGHGAHGFFRDGRRVLEVHLIECAIGHAIPGNPVGLTKSAAKFPRNPLTSPQFGSGLPGFRRALPPASGGSALPLTHWPILWPSPPLFKTAETKRFS